MRARPGRPGPWLVVLLAVSCTGSPSAVPSSTTPMVGGDLLTVASTQASISLIRFRLADSSASTIPAPIDTEAVNRSTVVGASVGDGVMFVTADTKSTHVYRLDAGTSVATPVGPPLPVAAGDEPLLSIGSHAAVVADRRGVWVLPLPGASRWLLAGVGTWAAVDTTGLTVAYSPDGQHVLVRKVHSDARPKPLFDTASLRRSLGPGVTQPRLVGSPAWGPAGLAFLVRAGDQLAVFIRDADGRTVKVLQETYANLFRVPHIAWQPSGMLLAIADDVGPSGAVLRVFDPTASTLHALSLAPVGFAGTAWAPDGRSIALLTGSGELVVVNLEGGWLLHRDTDWRGLLAWNGAP